MPLELGMFLAAKKFGQKPHTDKLCLILDRSQYRYQKFISDIAGQDIRSHNGAQKEAVTVTRNWLRTSSGGQLPGGSEIDRLYRKYRAALPEILRVLRLRAAEMTFNDYTNIAAEWIKAERAVASVKTKASGR